MTTPTDITKISGVMVWYVCPACGGTRQLPSGVLCHKCDFGRILSPMPVDEFARWVREIVDQQAQP